MQDHDDAPTRPATRKAWLYPALIAIAAAVVYADSFQGAFLYDDYDSIVDNRHIRVLWPLAEAMSRPLADAAETVSTRPLLSLSFAWNYAIGGLDPFGYHLVNLLIHVAAGCLLYALLRRTLELPRFSASFGGRAGEVALAVALLWIVHPLGTSAVTYIVQRAESLGGMLLLATLYACQRGMLGPPGARTRDGAGSSRHVVAGTGHARWDSIGWYTVAALACLLGVAAKETVAAAPLLALVYDATFVSGSYRRALSQRALLYLALAAAWIPLYALRSSDTAELVGGGRTLAYLATQPGVLVHYLRLSVWPRPLVMSYEWPYATGLADVLAPAAVVSCLLALTAFGVVRRRWYGFVGAWFFAILAPSSSIFDLTQRAMEHRMYLPLAAVVTCVVVGADALLRRSLATARARAAVALAAVTVAVLALGGTTWTRNRAYASEVGFWRDNVAKRPDNYIAHLQLGRAYLRAGEIAPAREALEAAVATGPPFAPVHIELGRALLALGDLARAESALQRAVALDGSLAPAYNNLGLIAERRGDLERAAEQYRAALAADADLRVAHENLARVLARSGAVDAAEREMAAALERRDVDAEVTTRIGMLLAAAGDVAQAEHSYRRAIRLDASFGPAYDALGILLARSGRLELAQSQFEHALEIDADDTDALQNLGAIHAEAGREQEAIETWERALGVDPALARVHYNLGLLYERRGDRAAAARLYASETGIDPTFALAWAARARIAAASGDVEQARRSYQHALGLAPDLAEARAGLAALP